MEVIRLTVYDCRRVARLIIVNQSGMDGQIEGVDENEEEKRWIMYCDCAFLKERWRGEERRGVERASCLWWLRI